MPFVGQEGAFPCRIAVREREDVAASSREAVLQRKARIVILRTETGAAKFTNYEHARALSH
jgi:hypothetical protein